VVSRQLLVLTSLFLASASAWAMPRGTIIIRGLNKEMSDVSWEVKGSQVKVMTDRGVRMFDLDDVELIPEIGVVDRDAPPKLPSRLQEKLQRRLTLLPPKGWRPVDFKQPLLAEAYKHPTAEAYLELWISPPGDYEFATEPGRLQNTRISDEAAKSLALRYAEAQRPTFAWAELAGKILLYGKGSIEVFGSEESWRLEEYRLRHGELEFAVAVRVENKTKLTDTSVEELLTRFSFLSPVSSTPERYIDQELGFYMLAPRSSWTLLARPFSRVEPVVATRGSGGDAEVRVEVLPSGTAQGIADDVVQEHKQQNSGFLEVKAVERSTRDGQEVVFYRLDDYPRGRRVLHSFMGLAVKTAAGKLLHFRGMADISDEESAKELRLLLECNQIDPFYRELHVRLGEAYEALEQPAKAAVEFEVAAAVQPSADRKYMPRDQQPPADDSPEELQARGALWIRAAKLRHRLGDQEKRDELLERAQKQVPGTDAANEARELQQEWRGR